MHINSLHWLFRSTWILEPGTQCSHSADGLREPGLGHLAKPGKHGLALGLAKESPGLGDPEMPFSRKPGQQMAFATGTVTSWYPPAKSSPGALCDFKDRPSALSGCPVFTVQLPLCSLGWEKLRASAGPSEGFRLRPGLKSR